MNRLKKKNLGENRPNMVYGRARELSREEILIRLMEVEVLLIDDLRNVKLQKYKTNLENSLEDSNL